jgi:hypothetical protein
MVAVVKLFGALGVIVAVILILASFATVYLMPVLLPVGASALLGGVLLLAFARVVELLESLDRKMSPVHVLAEQLAAKYQAQIHPQGEAAAAPRDAQRASFGDASFPPGTIVYDAKGVQVAILPDKSVLADLPGGEARFNSAIEYREYASDKDQWTQLRKY